VNCEQARLLIGADPRSSAAELAAHLSTCPACTQLREQSLAFETRIEQALQQPPDLARLRARRPAPRWREWALAASVLLGMAALLGVWLLRPSDTLAHDIVTHVEHEPDSWLSAQQVNAQGIGAALHGAGVALDLTSDKITYAQSCWFHGHYVPHLVVQTAQGPATVLILRHEQVAGARSFRAGGLNGIIVPAAAGRGSIAVLARGGSVDAVAREMQQDVRWLPEPP
jgi:Protein of unknown function (DUF3379)